MPPADALVLFDIDGTLLRKAGPHHREALIAAVRSVTGIETTNHLIPTQGMLDRDIIAVMLRTAGASPDAARYAGEGAGPSSPTNRQQRSRLGLRIRIPVIAAFRSAVPMTRGDRAVVTGLSGEVALDRGHDASLERSAVEGELSAAE